MWLPWHAICLKNCCQMEWLTRHPDVGPNRAISPADIEAARVNFARLMPATAERVVDFWKTRPTL